MGIFLLLAAGLPEDIAISSPETRVLVSFIKLRIQLTLKSLHSSENIVSTIKVSSTFAEIVILAYFIWNATQIYYL